MFWNKPWLEKRGTERRRKRGNDPKHFGKIRRDGFSERFPEGGEKMRPYSISASIRRFFAHLRSGYGRDRQCEERSPRQSRILPDNLELGWVAVTE
jgi:hypothetical protein